MIAVEVRVRFFSHLRDLALAGEKTLSLPGASTVNDLLQQLYLETPALAKADKTILVAAGTDFVDRDYVIRENDEISIMPPVQGG